MTIPTEPGEPWHVAGEPKARGRWLRPGALLPVVPLAIAVAIAATALYTDDAHRQRQQRQLHSEMSVKMAIALEHVEDHFGRIHSMLSYVGSDPDVVAMRTEAPAHIQALFDHESATHRLSEMYIIPRDFTGTRPPLMVFETNSDHQDPDEAHSPEDEESEYQIQIAQLRQFAEQPELRGLISDEIPLCLDQPDGTQAAGLVCSVPVRNRGEFSAARGDAETVDVDAGATQ